MRTLESASMEWLARIGVEVPRTIRVTDAEGLSAVRAAIPAPWVLKPDTAESGKGLRGQVFVCRDEEALAAAFTDVHTVSDSGAVVAEYVEGSECYASIGLDTGHGGAVLRVSRSGGVGFDASTAVTVPISMTRGLTGYEIGTALRDAGVEPALTRPLSRAVQAIWQAFTVSEATLIEVNPFRWNGERLVAVGVAVEFEDYSGWLATRYRPRGLSPATRPRTAREEAVANADAAFPDRPSVKFFELDGDVAALVVGGGAGLVVLDRLVDLGLRPSCYVDGSPGAPQSKLVELIAAGLSTPDVRGGIVGAVVMSLMDTRELAESLVAALDRTSYDATEKPLVVRIAGPNEEESRKLLGDRAPAVTFVGREASLDDACGMLAGALDARTPRAEGAS
ncbi:ATP-grasp domain-containing protein [Amycolatopsis alkalitolerans]|uniref:ATP-grasp domain-containing protein n=1 Tax=Amycolatopsis alkalitolerans TaxID=2547244 RepID=A0A5C4M2Z0_9PSEU|nr:ATP-grasp domain-containing protein [Amycolatopsis alkalitolerans]TNC25161.1 hypothetical protein FG385_16075 [Amycolatopsis alkalitolerans]